MMAGLRPKAGEAGEELACRHLRAKGLIVLARNFRCRGGEIDIVARDGDTVVFVEVKERSAGSHGTAIEFVTRAKQARVARAARLYAVKFGLAEDCPIRFDVVAVDWSDGKARIRHEIGAFDDGSAAGR